MGLLLSHLLYRPDGIVSNEKNAVKLSLGLGIGMEGLASVRFGEKGKGPYD
jgi:hypothetical protein